MMHVYVIYELQPEEKQKMRLMKEKKRNGSFTFDSGVVPVRRPLSCVKSV